MEEAKVSKTPQSYATYHDHTQESSSQSSSADNGDPQTPSPLYSEPIPNCAVNGPQIVEDDISKAIATETLDPQLARLLTSLSLSALVLNKSDKTSALSIKTNEPAPSEPATPVPVSAITASSTNSHSHSEMMKHNDWSSSAPKRLPNRPEVSPFTFSHAPSRRSSVETSPFSSRRQPISPRSFNPPSQASRTQPYTGPNHTEPHSAAYSSASSTASSAISPSRSLSSRRSSSTTDISPYLLRSAEMPVSGKQLKHLALLESVADESARMTPILGKRESLYPGYSNANPLSFSARPPHAPAPTAPLPPSFQPSGPNDLGAFYSSPSAVLLSAPVSMSHTQQPPAQEEAFRALPQTSIAYQRGPFYPGSLPGNVSMNQNQLLATMNGPRGADSQPPHVQSNAHATFYANLSNGSHSISGSHSMCLPDPASATSSTFGSTAPHSAPHPTRVNNYNSQLLSILNGDPTAGNRGITLNSISH